MISPWIIEEPRRDIEAQVKALLDPSRPKQSCFIAPGHAVPDIPNGLGRLTNQNGTLLSNDKEKMSAFSKSDLTEADMASILDYPEPKNEKTVMVIQARDHEGNVIHESGVSHEGLLNGISWMMNYVPPEGKLELLPVLDVYARRISHRDSK